MALNVYVALCYYKLDYYDVSQEVLSVYLNQHPNSTIAINLKACNLFRYYFKKILYLRIYHTYRKITSMSLYLDFIMEKLLKMN